MDKKDSHRLGDLARQIGGEVRGDANRIICGFQPLETASKDDLTFLAHPKYGEAAQRCPAAAILVPAGMDIAGRNLLVVPNPYLGVARLLRIFHQEGLSRGPRRQEAYLGDDCTLGAGIALFPGVVIGDRCRLGDRVAVLPGTVVGDDVEIGPDAVLHPQVTVYARSRIGPRAIIHSGTVIGSDGFGYAQEAGVFHKIPQVGNVVIEEDVEIGANVTIDRGTFGSTIVGRGTKIDNLVQIGHNCRIGEHCALVAQVGLSGSVRVGNRVSLAGQAGVVGHLVIGDDARIGARSVVTGNVEPGAYLLGHPATHHTVWKRAQVAWRRLPEILRRLRNLEGGRIPPDNRKEE